MRKGLWCGVIVGLLGTGTSSAQQFVDDQFMLLRPALSVGVFQELGAFPCATANGFVAGTGWGSFLCEKAQFDYSGGTVCGTEGCSGDGFDATGAFYQIALRNATGDELNCPLAFGGSGPARVFEIERRDGNSVEVIARVPTHRNLGACGGTRPPECPFNQDYIQSTVLLNMVGDAINGSLYLAVFSALSCQGASFQYGYGIVKVGGLPTLLDIIPTFTPATGTLSWVTPKHPEALPTADRFQVFTGDLRDLPDFGRALPIDCSVPDAGAPRPGDFLSILDPLPDPPVGRGGYVIIGVEHAGQRRFGRQNIDGVLSGRNPAAFSPCG
jgi:hypothetical protein